MAEAAVVIEGLRKVYPGRVVALDGVDLEVGRGMFGLLGPNGAGKTTLMRIVATILEPTAGRVEVLGLPLREAQQIRRQLGYLPQTFGFYPGVTAYETVRYFAALGGHRLGRAVTLDALERVGLEAAAFRRAGAMSGGMRQRLGLCVALIGDPQLLIVDEPTAGLDPAGRVDYRNLLAGISGDRLVILSTHIVADVEACCGRLAVIDRGSIAFLGTPGELARKAHGHTFALTVPGERVREVSARLRTTAIVTREGQAGLRVLAEEMAEAAGLAGVEVTPVEPTVEEGYLWLTNPPRR